MRKIINAILGLLLVPLLSFCQSKPIEGKTINPKFEKRINQLIDHSIPTLTVMELAKDKEQYLLLDARELEEYKTSHIPGAKHIGYDDFDIDLQPVPLDGEEGAAPQKRKSSKGSILSIPEVWMAGGALIIVAVMCGTGAFGAETNNNHAENAQPVTALTLEQW